MNRRLAVAAVLAISFAVYARTLTFPFIYDDLQIVQGEYLTSWRYLPHLLGAGMWNQGWDITGKASVGAYYRPAYFALLLLNRNIFGLHPWGWHLTSVLLHTATTGLVYVLARKLILDGWIAALAALLFGVHPVHIESVAWVAGCVEPLVTIFFLGSFLCFLDARRSASRWRQATSLGLFGGALLCKETPLVLPALIGLWVLLEEQGGWTRRIRASVLAALPFVGVAGLYFVGRVALFRGLPSALSQISFGTMALTWPSIVWLYLRHLAWPAHLSLFYDTVYVTTPTWTNFGAPLLGIVVALGLPLLLARRSRVVVFCILWVPIMLVPVLNFRVFHWREIAHDRYLYIPSVGFCIAIAWAIGRIPSQVRTFGRPVWQVLLVVVLVAGSAFLTTRESTPWSSPLLMAFNAFQVAPNNIAAVTLLGNEMLTRGHLDEAADLYERATRLAPNWWEAHFILGGIEMDRGHSADAARHLERAYDLNPQSEPVRRLLEQARQAQAH